MRYEIQIIRRYKMKFDSFKEAHGRHLINAVDMSEITARDAVFLENLDQGAANVMLKQRGKVHEDDLFKQRIRDRVKRELQALCLTGDDLLIIGILGGVGGIAVPAARAADSDALGKIGVVLKKPHRRDTVF